MVRSMGAARVLQSESATATRAHDELPSSALIYLKLLISL
jgi:hypothetical protein